MVSGRFRQRQEIDPTTGKPFQAPSPVPTLSQTPGTPDWRVPQTGQQGFGGFDRPSDGSSSSELVFMKHPLTGEVNYFNP